MLSKLTSYIDLLSLTDPFEGWVLSLQSEGKAHWAEHQPWVGQSLDFRRRKHCILKGISPSLSSSLDQVISFPLAHHQLLLHERDSGTRSPF